MMKNQKGITLIALVITIIVLLILAGVSIAMLTGENGILTKASGAKTTSTKAEIEESIKLAVAEILANKYDPAYTDSKNTLTGANIKAIVESNNSNITLSAETDTAASGDVPGYATLKATVNGTTETWYVTDNGVTTQTQPQ